MSQFRPSRLTVGRQGLASSNTCPDPGQLADVQNLVRLQRQVPLGIVLAERDGGTGVSGEFRPVDRLNQVVFEFAIRNNIWKQIPLRISKFQFVATAEYPWRIGLRTDAKPVNAVGARLNLTTCAR